jgi:hypothetical protein
MPRDAARGDAVRDARRLLRPLREETLALAQALVRVDTVAIPPDGHETPAQRRLASALRRHGIDVELYDTGFLERSQPLRAPGRKYRAVTTRRSRPGTGRGRSLLLRDTDTVPTGPNRRTAVRRHLPGRLLGREPDEGRPCRVRRDRPVGAGLRPGRRPDRRVGGRRGVRVGGDAGRRLRDHCRRLRDRRAHERGGPGACAAATSSTSSAAP